MIRWIMVLFYILIGPALITANVPDTELTVSLFLASAIAGLAVARIHWRQPTTGGRASVAVGTCIACFMGGGFVAVGLLALAFASDSGEHAELLGKMMIGLVYGMLIVAPPLGALVGSGVSAAFRRSKDKASKKETEPAP